MKQFEAYRSFSAGVHVFVPQDAAAYEAGKPTAGFGIIRYGEGSVYYGDVYFDGTNYEKLGYGRQDFMLSQVGVMDPVRGIRRAFYMGQFDYRVTNWICGNGVMYYVDRNNQPACFVKGYYEDVYRMKDYQGEFDYAQLPDGFTAEMEAFFDSWDDRLEGKMKNLEQVETLENLFIGDSYFDYWNEPVWDGNSIFDGFSPKTTLNIGIGGATYPLWSRFPARAGGMPCPKRIFLNLGFNDLHCYRSPERSFEDYRNFLQSLKAVFPEAEYYLLNVVQAPNYLDMAEKEERFNAMTAATAQELGVTVLDMRSAIEAVGGIETAFVEDGVHLNSLGYAQMMKLVKTAAGC